jgi:oligopeptide/dipeptide ABC transporter ATP-binding protein
MSEALLEVRGLKTYFFLERGIVKAVDGINFTIHKGRTLGLVGESGCGKSVTALSIMRLVPSPPGKIIAGEVYFEGENLLALSDDEIRKIRGARIAMIFQDPTAALNPVYTIGEQIAEAIQLHQGLSKKEAYERAAEMLGLVGIPSAHERIHDYPHQFSGGMRQRAMIAMALSCRPSLLIADEATTNLDVTIQAQILELMRRLKKTFDSSILLITHDLGIVAEMCDDVAIMYAGDIVEYADSMSLFYNTRHPYTLGLLRCIPSRNRGVERLHSIEGTIPDLISPPQGCKFHPRCPMAVELCKREKPQLVEVEPGHFVACYLAA